MTNCLDCFNLKRELVKVNTWSINCKVNQDLEVYYWNDDLECSKFNKIESAHLPATKNLKRQHEIIKEMSDLAHRLSNLTKDALDNAFHDTNLETQKEINKQATKIKNKKRELETEFEYLTNEMDYLFHKSEIQNTVNR